MTVLQRRRSCALAYLVLAFVLLGYRLATPAAAGGSGANNMENSKEGGARDYNQNAANSLYSARLGGGGGGVGGVGGGGGGVGGVGGGAASNKRNMRSIYGLGPKMLQISRSKIPIELDLLVENGEDGEERLAKRTFDDYGHMRFGKRGGGEQFDDYGHMRFGRSA